MLLKKNNMTKYTCPNEMHPFFSWKYYSSNYVEIWYLRGHWLISHRSLCSWIPAQWMTVSNLFKDISRSLFLAVMDIYITHCFKCGVKMSVFPTNGAFSFPQKKFHCGSMVLLTVIFFFITSSSGTSLQWTLKLSSQRRNGFVNLKNSHF